MAPQANGQQDHGSNPASSSDDDGINADGKIIRNVMNEKKVKLAPSVKK